MNSPTSSTDTTAKAWTIDPAHSQVEFSVPHMMISNVKGSFEALEGTIHLNEDEFTASSVGVTIEAGSITTRNEDRDNHLRSGDFFDVESHPHLRFSSDRVEGTPESFRITGSLTVRGNTRTVTLEGEELGRGTDPWGNPRVGFRASTEISREEFGLTWNQALETGGVLVGDKVKISLEVQAIPASDESGEG